MKIFKAYYDSRNFNFEAYGHSDSEALNALLNALKLHGKQYDLDADWYEGEDVFVIEYEIGKPYRARQEIKVSN